MDNSVISAWTSALPNLTRLELLGPYLVHAGTWPAFFESHPNLQGFLITQSPRFDLACMESLVNNCKNLTELRLKEIGQMSDDFLAHIKKLSGTLEYLDLSYPGDPTALTADALVDLMAAVGSGLTHLDLSGNHALGDGFLYQGLKPHARRLHALVLTNVPELTDAGVAEFFDTWALARDAPNPPLTRAELARNHALGSKALAALLKHSGAHLEQLNINGWKEASEEELTSIGDAAPGLRKIDIGWCRLATDWTVKALLQKCQTLEEVKVWGCQRVTENCPRKVCGLSRLVLTRYLTAMVQRNVTILGIETQSHV